MTSVPLLLLALLVVPETVAAFRRVVRKEEVVVDGEEEEEDEEADALATTVMPIDRVLLVLGLQGRRLLLPTLLDLLLPKKPGWVLR